VIFIGPNKAFAVLDICMAMSIITKKKFLRVTHFSNDLFNQTRHQRWHCKEIHCNNSPPIVVVNTKFIMFRTDHLKEIPLRGQCWISTNFHNSNSREL